MTDPAITAALAIPALGSNPHPTKGTPPMNLNDITLTATRLGTGETSAWMITQTEVDRVKAEMQAAS